MDSRRSISRLQRALVWPAVIFIRIYQRTVSPLLPATLCRFHPSCSEYARQALETRGLFVGAGLAGWRILRCNPFSRGGFDPVPAPKTRHEASNVA